MDSKYDDAFELLGERWQTISDTQRHVLVGIAEQSKEVFTPGPQFTQEVMPVCHGLDSLRVMNCLKLIQILYKKDLEENRSLIMESIQKSSQEIRAILEQLEQRLCA